MLPRRHKKHIGILIEKQEMYECHGLHARKLTYIISAFLWVVRRFSINIWIEVHFFGIDSDQIPALLVLCCVTFIF